MLMQSHLRTTKWKDSAFSHSLIKSSRWLLGASRRVDHNYMRSLLLVTPEIQAGYRCLSRCSDDSGLYRHFVRLSSCATTSSLS